MEKNPYEGAIATNFSEMKRISETSRPYEGTGQGMEWRNVRTGQTIATNF